MLNIITDQTMVPQLSVLSLVLCYEALEGGGYQQMGTIKYAKRNFPSRSLHSQFTASQKPPLLFPNAKTVVSILWCPLYANGSLRSPEGIEQWRLHMARFARCRRAHRSAKADLFTRRTSASIN